MLTWLALSYITAYRKSDPVDALVDAQLERVVRGETHIQPCQRHSAAPHLSVVRGPNMIPLGRNRKGQLHTARSKNSRRVGGFLLSASRRWNHVSLGGTHVIPVAGQLMTGKETGSRGGFVAQ